MSTTQPVEDRVVLTEEERRRTMRLSLWDGATWSLMFGMGDMCLSAFAVFLDAGNRALGLLGAMPPLLGSLAQWMGALLADRTGRRRAIIVASVIPQALLFLPLYAVPLAVGAQANAWLLLFAALSIALANLGGPAWLSLMGDIVPEDRRGDYFGMRTRLTIVLLFLAHLAAGGLLSLGERIGRPAWGFVAIFTIACAARLLSARVLALHADPPYRPRREDAFSFWAFLRRMPRANFGRFAIFQAAMLGSVNIAGPFFAPYCLRDLGWSYMQFMLSTALVLVSQSMTVRAWGRLGDRHGNRAVLIASGCMLCVLPALWLLTQRYTIILCIQFFAGIGWGGFSLAVQNFMYDAVTPPKRARIASYTSMLNGLAVLAGGSLIGATLANHLPTTWNFGLFRLDYHSVFPGVFAVSSIARIGSMFLLPRVNEVRTAEPAHPAMLVFRMMGGRIAAEFLSQAWPGLSKRIPVLSHRGVRRAPTTPAAKKQD